MNTEAHLIRDRKQVTQAVEFNLSSGKIHPTDIDAVFEFDNDVLILFEVKRRDNPMTTGQNLVLQRLIDNWSGRYAVALFCWHDVLNSDESIILNECDIVHSYENWNSRRGEWIQRNEKVDTAVKRIAEIFNIKKLSQLK
jgi:hypothetical protein